MAQYDTLYLPFRAITIEDGLSQGMIHNLMQDSKGFLWCTTKDGLNRYDGYRFKVFRHNSADSATIANNYTDHILEDRRGWIWVSTGGVLDLFDPHTETFTHFPLSADSTRANDRLYGNDITGLGEDPDGNVWVSTNAGLFRMTVPAKGLPDPRLVGVRTIMRSAHGFSFLITAEGILLGDERGVSGFFLDTRNEHLRPERQLMDGVPVERLGDQPQHYRVYSEDPTHTAVYATNGFGIYRYEAGSGHGSALFEEAAMGHAFGTTQFAVDQKDRSWFPGLNFTWRYDTRTRQLHRILPRDPNLRRAVDNGSSSYVDRNGLVWIGTKGYGLLVFDPRTERFRPKTSGSVDWMAPTDDGRLMVGKQDGAAVFDPVSESYVLPLDAVALTRTTGFNQGFSLPRCAVQDPDGVFWCSYGHLERYDPRKATLERFRYRLPDGSVLRQGPDYFPLHVAMNGVLWYGDASALYSFDRGSHTHVRHPFPLQHGDFPYPFVSHIHEDAHGTLWIGTMSGLLRFDPATSEWKHYHNDPRDAGTLSSDMIFSIAADTKEPDRWLWIGTNGGGLNRMEIGTGKMEHWTTAQGLPNDVVYGVLVDTNGDLWMSTNKGIARFTPSTDVFRLYDAKDGLQGDEFNRYAFCSLKDGTLCFGGVNGFNWFTPDEVKDDPTPVPVVITDILLNNKSLPFGMKGSLLSAPAHLTEGISIPYADATMLTIEFVAAHFGTPEENHFQFLLEGFNTARITAGRDHAAIYTNLDPGSYTFKVWGRNPDDIWNTAPTELAITILPPWWRTGWFYASLLLAIGGAAVLYVRMLKMRNVKLERTVSERTKELRAAKERAERSELVKQQFLANMSHEIRTPMNAIMGMGNALHRMEHLPEQEPVIDAITSSSKNLLVIVNDILDLSKIEAGSMRFEKIPMDPRAVLQDVMGVLRYRAEESGLAMEVEVAPDVPQRVLGDPTRLHQVLLNIVGNAVKFTEHGRVHVTVSVKERLKDTTMLQFSITDTGIGIAPERLPFVFDEFTQAETDHTRMYGGTGLGLTICKRLVEMQGGTIGATSTPGKGSTFTFSIPYPTAPVDAPAAQPDHRHPGTPAFAGDTDDLHDLRILLAEDNKMNVMVARQELKHAIPGVRIDVADNGQLAVEMLQANDYDLLLMDVRMPVMDGFAATRAIRALGGDKSRIPIVAMTANVLGQGSECTAAGMDAYVPKPIQSEVLVARLREVLPH